MPYARRSPSGDGRSASGAGVVECELSRKLPSLWGFLSDDTWDDGSRREPGTMLVCVGDGQVRVWLHDKAECMSAWLSADSLLEALLRAEEGLSESTLPWRQDKSDKKRK